MERFITARSAIIFPILKSAISAMMKKEKDQLSVLLKIFRMLWLLKIQGNSKDCIMFLEV